jgi:hypothetical protein
VKIILRDNDIDRVDLTSNWCIPAPPVNHYKIDRALLNERRSEAFPRLPYIGTSEEQPYFGAHGDEEIPVPIPNTEVKLVSGDYTATSGKLARRRII